MIPLKIIEAFVMKSTAESVADKRLELASTVFLRSCKRNSVVIQLYNMYKYGNIINVSNDFSHF